MGPVSMPMLAVMRTRQGHPSFLFTPLAQEVPVMFMCVAAVPDVISLEATHAPFSSTPLSAALR